MKKRIALLLTAVLAVGTLATACGGNANSGSEVSVGLGLHTQMNYSSKEATAEENGLAQADLTIAAVTLDADGKIVDVKVDAIQVKTKFDATGVLAADNATEFKTKRQLGNDYNMKGTSAGIGKIDGGAEWFEQADFFETFCKGKTVEEVKAAMGAEQYPTDEALLLGCTMKINGFVAAVEKAVAEAKTGTYKAASTDKLSIGLVAEPSGSKSATAEEAGATTAYANFVAVTSADSKITCCILDSVQAKFAWDATGKFTSDLTVDTTTKYDLKEAYGMKDTSAGIGKINGGGEWYEQADFFMNHVKGKTADEVLAIAVNEEGKTTDEALSLGCTMTVTAYIKAVAMALGK